MNKLEDNLEVQTTVSELSFALDAMYDDIIGSVLSKSPHTSLDDAGDADEDADEDADGDADGDADRDVDEDTDGYSRNFSFLNSLSAEMIPKKRGKEINMSIESTKRINFMVAGLSGSGKTKYCNRFLQRYFPEFKMKKTSGQPTMRIEERGRCQKMQGNMRIIVTVVDAPGYGDTMNNIDRLTPVEEYIVKQNEIFEKKEMFRNPNRMENDSRIHCIFYFFSPHRVTPIDREFLRRLQLKVAVVPIIGKADTMQTHELKKHLRLVQETLEKEKIQTFDFGETDIDVSWIKEEDEEEENDDLMEQDDPTGKFDRKEKYLTVSHEYAALRQLPRIPNIFAVISGVRRYPWGKSSEHDPRHSDTERLHSVLFQEGSIGKLLKHADDIHEAWRLDAEAKERDKIEAEKLRTKISNATKKDNLPRSPEEEKQKRRIEEEEKQKEFAKQIASKATILILLVLNIFLGFTLSMMKHDQ